MRSTMLCEPTLGEAAGVSARGSEALRERRWWDFFSILLSNLVQPSPPLTRNTINSTLATMWLGRRLELFDCLTSTNREAVQLAQADVEHGTVVVAESQTAGRGRLSRTWFSPPDVNLYCSIILRTGRPPERLTEWLSWLPLVSALATAEAIEQVSSTHVSVKWPNDLLISERKVGGILCESGTGTGSDPFQIIGIGINVNGDEDDWPIDLRSVSDVDLAGTEDGCRPQQTARTAASRTRTLSR